MKNKKIKIVIILLAVLLAVSLGALCAILIYKNLKIQTYSTSIQDNYVTNSEKTVPADTAETETDAVSSETDAGTEADAETSAAEAELKDGATVREYVLAAVNEEAENDGSSAADAETTTEVKSVAIELSSRNSDDNVPFHVENMFPGDSITKYFRVAVYYKNTVYVRYHADVRPGYEKLAEVLKCRIVLDGELLYDGLMKDMPESLTHTLTTNEEKTETKLLYEITAYLDTSVGNEYQEKDLIADFRWWVEEKGNLTPPPTGDASHIVIWAAVAAVSLSLLLVIIFKRRRRKEEDIDE